MRVSTPEGRFRAKAIAGTRAVMIALDCDDSARKGLLGFAFRRQRVGTDPEPKWLRSLKVFESVVPKPDPDKAITAPMSFRFRASCGATSGGSRAPPISSRSSPHWANGAS